MTVFTSLPKYRETSLPKFGEASKENETKEELQSLCSSLLTGENILSKDLSSRPLVQRYLPYWKKFVLDQGERFAKKLLQQGHATTESGQRFACRAIDRKSRYGLMQALGMVKGHHNGQTIAEKQK